MPPDWLVSVAVVSLGTAAACSAAIVVDVLVRGYRQAMPVMEWVWPITALYLGPLALWAYVRHGRRYAPKRQAELGISGPDAPRWVRIGISTSHCGAGCTLGDIAAEWIIFAFGLSLFGATIFASYGLDYLFAFGLGIVFQAFALRQMGIRDLGELARRTAKADAYSLTAFELGLFAWMGLTFFVFFTDPHLQPDSVVFWFMMQVGMAIGFATSYPANAWLIRRHVKEAM
jgi:hypothetical protein